MVALGSAKDGGVYIFYTPIFEPFFDFNHSASRVHLKAAGEGLQLYGISVFAVQMQGAGKPVDKLRQCRNESRQQ